MRKKFLIITSLSLASVVTATAAIACAPIDQSISQDKLEEKLQQIVDELTNKSWTSNVKDEVDVVKSKFEAITSDYKNKLLNLISDGDYLGYLLGDIKITKMEVANASEYVINLKLLFSYEENGVVATREGYLNIVNFALKDWERVARFLSTEIEKFTDRKLKKDSSNKQLLPAKSDINSLESWNNNTVGEPISFDKDINVTITRTQSDTAKGISVFEVKLEKLGQIREKTIKVRGFKTKYLDRNEKAVEATVNNFTLTKATLDRGDIYFPEGMIHDWNGTRKSHSNEFRIDHEKWAKVNSNSHLRASAFKPTILDNQKFEQSQYFDQNAYKYLQARLVEKNKIKLEEGVTGEVKIVSSDDIKGEVVVSITFVKGEAGSEEKLVTISNFLSRRELVGIAFDTYYESLKK
ncbi:lipoprotein 17-related variable surface protein [Mycoplasmopsis agassizii]|uniref:lipoprotein 17-related variable surface protein n=1 Tax=Mycoplasmopsis agassizii TaxID=33922 RepID=UPI003528D6C8